MCGGPVVCCFEREKMAEREFERAWVEETEHLIEVVQWREQEMWEWAQIMGVTGNLVTSTGEIFFLRN